MLVDELQVRYRNCAGVQIVQMGILKKETRDIRQIQRAK